jgi:hypothetical protein
MNYAKRRAVGRHAGGGLGVVLPLIDYYEDTEYEDT